MERTFVFRKDMCRNHDTSPTGLGKEVDFVRLESYATSEKRKKMLENSQPLDITSRFRDHHPHSSFPRGSPPPSSSAPLHHIILVQHPHPAPSSHTETCSTRLAFLTLHSPSPDHSAEHPTEKDPSVIPKYDTASYPLSSLPSHTPKQLRNPAAV
jgi:hypothetical protein